MKINRQDTNGVKPLLAVGELGYDNYLSGGDIGRVYVGNGAENIPQAKKSEVVTVDGKVDTHVSRVNNPHSVTKTQVGLSNVDNTSDLNKPVSTAMQNALDLKQNVLVSGTNIKTIEGQSIVGTGNIDLTKTDVGLSNVDNTADSTKVVASAGKWTTGRLINGTTVDGTVNITTSQWGSSRNITIGNTSKTVNGSGDVSWTLTEIGAIGTSSPAFTGVPTAPTAPVNNNSNHIATTAYVDIQVANTAVKLTENQTIAGVKTFSSNIVGNITGNAATATKLNTARTINGVAFDGSSNITVSDATAVNLTVDQTIAGVKTFSSSPIVPTPIADFQVATKKYVDDTIFKLSTDYYQGPYGFNWDYSTDTYIRTGAAGYTSIQAMMKRCVLNANGTVNYYLHPTNSNFKADGTPSILTGADGNVMVQVPKFYAKVETVGNVNKYSISLTPDAGYVVHPWFVKAGVEVDYRYYRAYTGYNSGGTLKSISGVTPTRTQTIATFRTQAKANGIGWHLTDWNAVNAIKLLCYIEFNDYIVTDYIGTGNDTGNEYGLTTGQSNAIGNTSSPSTNNSTWMSYRGIENFYADCWEFLDGVNIKNYVFYVNQNYTTFASDVFTGDYVSKGTTIAASASYITRCAVSVGGGWIPSVIDGASTTYYGDGFWSATGARVALFGGSADHGADYGAGALSVDYASSASDVDFGGAVCF